VFGLWHLGTVTAACLASEGHEVIGLDFDDAVVDELKRGKPPIFEPGLEELIKGSANLSFTTKAAKAVERRVGGIRHAGGSGRQRGY
jgi:UDPglucose 6-dehydrogenase